jgi:four helix bundle protein
VADIYTITKKFPNDERYALCDQMQRASVSVPANIAEGHARSSRNEFLHFLSISLGSLAELETHLTIASRLSYVTEEKTQKLLDQTNLLGKRIRSLQKSLNNKAT